MSCVHQAWLPHPSHGSSSHSCHLSPFSYPKIRKKSDTALPKKGNNSHQNTTTTHTHRQLFNLRLSHSLTPPYAPTYTYTLTMVSFTCNRCQDVIKKPKAISHAQSCGTSHYCCVDCMQVFDIDAVRAHNTCVSEEEKYQGRWKNKNYTGPKKREGPLVDSDNEDEEHKLKKDKALLMQRVRPCSKNFLVSSSDSDDSDSDDGTSKANKKTAAAAVAAKPNAAGSSKRAFINRDDSDSDEEGDATTAAAAKSKKAKVAVGSRSPARKPATPKAAADSKKRTRPEADGSDKDGCPNMNKRASAEEDKDGKNTKSSSNSSSKASRQTPALLLPASTAAMAEAGGEVAVEGFTLGPHAQVAGIIRDIIEHHHSGETKGNIKKTTKRGPAMAMPSKELAKELVDRYRNRIAKQLRSALSAAVAASNGELSLDEDGNICC